MSLHTLANHLQTAGRGNDSVLVHMTPGEVQGLQSLAMAHGGSLSVNPETGLPEAGFLSSLLPTLAGAALAATGVGAPMAALMVGGAGAAMTGSLSKGLMMGLGAYGGAGLGAGLAGSAASAGSSLASGAQSVAPQFASMGAPAASVAPNAYTALTTPLANTAGAINPAGTFAGLPGTNVNAMASAYGATNPALPNATQVAQAPLVSTPNAPNMSIAQPPAPSVLDNVRNLPSKAMDLISKGGKEGDDARKEFFDQYKRPLMMSGLSADAAIDRLREKRSTYALCNGEFEHWLLTQAHKHIESKLMSRKSA